MKNAFIPLVTRHFMPLFLGPLFPLAFYSLENTLLSLNVQHRCVPFRSCQSRYSHIPQRATLTTLTGQ